MKTLLIHWLLHHLLRINGRRAYLSLLPFCLAAAYGETIALSFDNNGNQTSQFSAIATIPVINGQPLNQIAALGGIASFSVNAFSVLPVIYQWKFNNSPIAGANSDSLLLTNISGSNEGSYTLTITNSLGEITSTPAMLLIDIDDDQIADSWEIEHFGNLDQAPGGDFDGDRISNLEEFRNGTNPKVREIFYWIAESGNFNDGSNWNYGLAPGPGDTGIINTGTFTLPTNSALDASKVIVNIPVTAPLDANFSLNVSGEWTFAGSFELASGRAFHVTGGGIVVITGTTNLAGSDLYVDGGAKLNFRNVTSYTPPAGLTVRWTAANIGAELNFPNLASITGNTATESYLNINSYYGGSIVSLPALTTITIPDDGDPHPNKGVIFTVNGANGLISAPLLSVFNDNDTHPNSSLTAYSDGVLFFPLLLAPIGVNLNLNALSHPEQFTSLVGTSTFHINSGIVTIDRLDSIDGFSEIYIDGGAKVTFPNVSAYTLPAGLTVRWTAANIGAELNFPNLASISGNTATESYLNINSFYGGSIVSLPALTTITIPDDGDPHPNKGVIFAVNGTNGLISAPLLSAFSDNDIHPNSSLTAYSEGVLSFPLLLAPRGVNLNLNALSHPEQFTSLVGTSSFHINSGIVTIDQLDSIGGFSEIYIDGGAKVTFPNVSAYTLPAGLTVRWTAANIGAELNFPNLVSISGNTATESYLNINSYYGGSIVSLPALTTITIPDDGDPHPNKGVIFTVNGADGLISAPLLSAFSDNDIHPNSSLTAYSGGVLSFPLLLAPRGVNLNLNALSHPEQFTSLVGTSSFHINSGIVTIDQLDSIAGFTEIYVDGGAKVTFPNITSYNLPAGLTVRWTAASGGAELNFPNLASINGNTGAESYLNINSFYGGSTISLPALSTITVPNDGDPYPNKGIIFTVNGANGLISAPLLSVFNDDDIHPNSSLNAYSDGIFVLSNLSLSGIKGVNLNGVSLNASLPPILQIHSVSMMGGNLKMSIRTRAEYSYQLQFSSTLGSGDWIDLNDPTLGNNQAIDFTAPLQSTKGFFRIKVISVP